MSTPRPARERLTRHSLTRVVVLPESKIMFLPTPKSGCTSLLWTMSEIAGIPRAKFKQTPTGEISAAMAIHDMDLWGPDFRWQAQSKSVQQEILTAPDWLRFSVVRNPGPRLWSAWQSKILLAEPRFVTRFAAEPWFPKKLTTSAELVAAFREFVAALAVDPDIAPHDAHWGPQVQLLAGFECNYVGRAENPQATREVLAAHLAKQGQQLPVTKFPRENANPIGFAPMVYDLATAEIVNQVYAEDFAAYGYPQVSAAEVDQDWASRAELRLELVNELVARHLRIGELLEVIAHQKNTIQRLGNPATPAVADKQSPFQTALQALKRPGR